MISDPAGLIELCMSLAALLGLLALHVFLRRRKGWDPISRRVLFCVRITMLLFMGRVLVMLTGWSLFRIPILVGAALIPLAALLLTEALLRRHAPPFVKQIIGWGTFVFLISALSFTGAIDPYRLYALMAFQIIGFGLSGWMILRRDRSSLSAQESITVTRLGLSLLVFIPLSTSDFLMAVLGLPIQFSALGVLILCWLVMGLGRTQLGHGVVMVNFAVMVSAALLVGVLIGEVAQMNGEGVLLCVATVMTALFLVAILNDARALRTEEQSLGLMRYLAEATTTDPIAFLRDLRSHPMVEGAAMISARSLDGLQEETLQHIFAVAPVLRRAAPPQLGDLADDHIAYLFDRYSATHVILASDAPRVLIALSMPSLNASPMAELELQVVQRMSALMSAKPAPKP